MIRKLVFFCALIFSSNLWSFEGFLEPIEVVDITASETGVIIKKSIAEGDVVRKNDTLVKLDSSVLSASLSGARADYQSKKLKYSQLQALFEQKIASAEELAIAKTQKAISLSQYQSIQQQIARRHIKSPINGIVTVMSKELGELVSLSSGPFIRVVNVSQLKLIVYIPYQDAAKLSLKQIVTVSVSGTEQAQKGLIRYISPVVDPASSTVKVELIIENKLSQIRSGVPAKVSLDG
ncbi:MAG: efflux RND transporter periplasmic adaptor subunit [Arenicella sp.]